MKSFTFKKTVLEEASEFGQFSIFRIKINLEIGKYFTFHILKNFEKHNLKDESLKAHRST